MIALGLDYGTTNSLVTAFSPEISSKELTVITRESAVQYENSYIRSPKRLLHNIRHTDQLKVSTCIESCVRNLLREIKQSLSSEELEQIKLAITIPNAFKDPECRILHSVVQQIYLEVFGKDDPSAISLIPEPVAAALYYAYCLQQAQGIRDRKYVVVSDMGGGTTDLAVVRIDYKCGQFIFKVLCTEHEFWLGGDDVDIAIANYITDKQELHEIAEKEYFLEACRYLKSMLSITDFAAVTLLDEQGYPYLKEGSEVELTLSQQELNLILSGGGSLDFEESFAGRYRTLLHKLAIQFKDYLEFKEGYSPMEIPNVLEENVVLLPIGGSSHLSIVGNELRATFQSAGKVLLNTEQLTKNHICGHYDSVVRGAAIYAAINARLVDNFCKDILIENRTMHRISVRYTDEKLYTCVPRSRPDGEYEFTCYPKALSKDKKTFTLNRLDFYQGGYGELMDEDCEPLHSIELPDKLYAHGRSRDEIPIVLTAKIEAGRLSQIKIVAKKGCKQGEDYEKVITF